MAPRRSSNTDAMNAQPLVERGAERRLGQCARQVLRRQQLRADRAAHGHGEAAVVLGDGALQQADAAAEQARRLVWMEQHPHRDGVRAAAGQCAECNRQQVLRTSSFTSIPDDSRRTPVSVCSSLVIRRHG
jgi:hypothetical protein